MSDEEYQSIVKNAHLIVDSVQLERDLISHQESVAGEYNDSNHTI